MDILIDLKKRVQSFSGKWDLSGLDIILLCITFYEFSFLPHFLFIAYKYLILIYLFAKYVKNIKHVRDIFICILLYGIITVFSTIYNGMKFTSIVASVVYVVQILDIMLIVNSYLRQKDVKELLTIIFKVYLVYIVLTDIAILFVHYDFANTEEEYLTGNKFIVSYMHFFASSLFFYLSRTLKWECINSDKLNFLKNERWRIISPFIFLFYSLLICSRVQCTTGMIMCFCLGVFMLLPAVIKKLLMNGEFILVFLLIMNILVLNSNSLFTNEYVAYFIKNVLKETTTWVGRLNIYSIIFDIIKGSPWIGYGYFSNVVSDTLYGNAQNGVLKVIVDSGVIGLAGYISFLYLGLKRIKDKNVLNWPFFAFCYVMVIASLVEINLTHMIMYLTVVIIYTINKNGNGCGKISETQGNL